MSALKDLTGKKFGRLRVVRRDGLIDNKPAWFCECDCGTNYTVRGSSLRSENTRSCGCLGRDIKSEMFKGNVYGRTKRKIFQPGERIGGWLYVEESEPSKRFRDGRGMLQRTRRHTLQCSNCGRVDTFLQPHLNRLAESICIQCDMIPKGIAGARRLYEIYRRNANSRGGKMLITFDEFLNLTSRPCVFCGLQPNKIIRSNPTAKSNWGDYCYNGIDRIDNSELNYTLENSAACCWDCNHAKRDRTLTEFKDYISRLTNYTVFSRPTAA